MKEKFAILLSRIIAQSNKDIKVFATVDYYPVRKESHRTNTTIVEAYAAEPSRKTLENIDKALTGSRN